VLGKLSGRAGFVARIGALGFRLTDGALERAFERFQTLADGQRVVGDEDLRRICEAEAA
jgi:2-isopropylmalate synthase